MFMADEPKKEEKKTTFASKPVVNKPASSMAAGINKGVSKAVSMASKNLEVKLDNSMMAEFLAMEAAENAGKKK